MAPTSFSAGAARGCRPRRGAHVAREPDVRSKPGSVTMRTRASLWVLVAALGGIAGGCDSGGSPTSAGTTPTASTRAATPPASRFAIRSFRSRWHADLGKPVDRVAGTIPRKTGDGEWSFEGAIAGKGTAVTGVLADPRSRHAKVATAERLGLADQVSFSLVMLQGSVQGCGAGTAVLWFYGDPATNSRWGIVPGFGTGELEGLAVDDATLEISSTGGAMRGTLRCQGAGSYLRIDHHPLFTTTPGPITERVQQEFCYLSGCAAGQQGGSGIFIVPWDKDYFDKKTNSLITQDHRHGVVGRAVGYWIGEGTAGVYVSMASPGSVVDDGLITATVVWSTTPLVKCGTGSRVLLQRTRANRYGDILDSVDEIVPGLGAGQQASLTGDGVENGTQHAPPSGGHWWSDLALHCGT